MDRRPVRRVRTVGDRWPADPFVLAGAGVVIVGYFSARQKGYASLMDAAVAEVTAHGGRVLGRAVQRRGVSRGGVRNMSLPFSSRTLLSYGKVREVAAVCAESGADAVVFLLPLTGRQRWALTEAFGCPAVSLADIRPAG